MLFIKAISVSGIAITAMASVLFYPIALPQRSHSVGPTAKQRAMWKHANTLEQQADDAWQKEKNYPKANSLFRQARAIDPRNPFLKQDYADFLHERGKSKEALRLYREVVRPANGGSGGNGYTLTLNRYADMCREAGDQKEANWAYGQVILNTSRFESGYPKITEIDLSTLPVKTMAKLAVGLVLQGQARDKEALELFTQAVKEEPNLALAHLYRGGSLERTIGWKATPALVEYRKALKLGDSDVKSQAQRRLD